MDKSALGNRMKMYEGMYAGERFTPLLPICIRIDGKCFHNFTAKMEKPFDDSLITAFRYTLRDLVKDTGAVIGYHQSDEITLILYSNRIDSQVFFDGKVQKIVSVVASKATKYFNKWFDDLTGGDRDVGTADNATSRAAEFDCRAWTVPTLEEAANVLIWRELDATKNSVQALAQVHFSHNQLQGKHTGELQEMLFTEKGINWNDLEDHKKRGSFCRRIKRFTKFSAEEIERLPINHAARTNPDLTIERSVVELCTLPRLLSITNKIAVLFNGSEPLLKTACQDENEEDDENY